MNNKIAYILALAVVLRIAAIFLLGRHINPEVWEYDTLALNMIHGKGYVMDALNTQYYSLGYPGYALFSALSHIITNNNYFILELVQVALAALTCFLVYLIGKKIFNEKAGLVAAFLAATHPGLIVYSTKIHEMVLVAFLIAIIAWLIISLDWTKKGSNFFVGILIGIGVLTRPTVIFFIPAYFLYIWVSSHRFRDSLIPGLITVAAVIMVILPWTVRNYNIHKRIIFITTSSAEHFWRGNNPNASGSSLTPGGISIIEAAPKEFQDKIYKLDEIGQSDLFYSETVSFIRSNPGFFIKMILKKFYYFWWFSPQTGLLYPGIWAIIYKVYYSFILFFFFLGLCFSFSALPRESKASVTLILAFLIMVSLLHSIYYVEMRHRWAIEPLMMIFSSQGLIGLFSRIYPRQVK